MAGYIKRRFTCPRAVTHHSTNLAQRKVTSLIEWNALPLYARPPPWHCNTEENGVQDVLPERWHLCAIFFVH